MARRSALPSMATTSSASAAKSRLKVSWLGMPWGSSRKVRRQGSLVSPKSALSSKLSAPQSAAGDEQEVCKLVQPGALDAGVGQFAQNAQEIDSLGGGGLGTGHPKRVSELFSKVHLW